MPAGPELREKIERFRGARSSLPVRWVPVENLHVTLVPPWRCDDEEAVCAKLRKRLAGRACLEARFSTIAVGPSRCRASLIWVSGGAHEAIGELGRILSSLAANRTDAEERDFLLHVTLARLKRGTSPRLRPETVDWRCTFDRVRLYESIPHPEGARYETICEVALKIP